MLLTQLLDQVLKGKENISLEAGASLVREHTRCAPSFSSCSMSWKSGLRTSLFRSRHFQRVVIRFTHAIRVRRSLRRAAPATVSERLLARGREYLADLPADIFAFTLDKTSGQFSPTTRYRDYAINRELIHWESQSTVRTSSPTGRRYQEHIQRRSHVLLFARLTTDDRAFYFLGPATYVSHQGNCRWRLPGDFNTRCLAICSRPLRRLLPNEWRAFLRRVRSTN
jgi:hypothetical protein